MAVGAGVFPNSDSPWAGLEGAQDTPRVRRRPCTSTAQSEFLVLASASALCLPGTSVSTMSRWATGGSSRAFSNPYPLGTARC